ISGLPFGQFVSISSPTVGAFTLSLFASNAVGCVSACSLSVEVVADTTPPALNCPPALTVPCASSVPRPADDLAALIAQGGSATDNSGTVTVSFLSDVATG